MTTTNENSGRRTFTSAKDFTAACAADKKLLPGTWAQLAACLIKAGHGDALNDVIPLLSTDTGIKVVRPNNAREVERMTASLGGSKGLRGKW
jgi:hypothetical protein